MAVSDRITFELDEKGAFQNVVIDCQNSISAVERETTIAGNNPMFAIDDVLVL